MVSHFVQCCKHLSRDSEQFAVREADSKLGTPILGTEGLGVSQILSKSVHLRSSDMEHIDEFLHGLKMSLQVSLLCRS